MKKRKRQQTWIKRNWSGMVRFKAKIKARCKGNDRINEVRSMTDDTSTFTHCVLLKQAGVILLGN